MKKEREDIREFLVLQPERTASRPSRLRSLRKTRPNRDSRESRFPRSRARELFRKELRGRKKWKRKKTRRAFDRCNASVRRQWRRGWFANRHGVRGATAVYVVHLFDDVTYWSNILSFPFCPRQPPTTPGHFFRQRSRPVSRPWHGDGNSPGGLISPSESALQPPDYVLLIFKSLVYNATPKKRRALIPQPSLIAAEFIRRGKGGPKSFRRQKKEEEKTVRIRKWGEKEEKPLRRAHHHFSKGCS